MTSPRVVPISDWMSAPPRRFVRAVLPAVASVGYVAVVGLRAGAHGAGAALVTAGALVLAWRAGSAPDRVVGWACWGAAVALAATLAAGRPLVGASGWLGVAVAAAAAGYAVGAIASPGGLAAQRATLRRRAVGGPFLAAWAIVPASGAAASLAGAWAVGPAWVAAGQLVVVAMLVVREWRARRLELGVPERARAVLGALAAAAVAIVGLLWTRAAPTLPSSLAVLGLLGPVVVLLARRGDPVRLGILTRVALVATLAGGGLVVCVELVRSERPQDTGVLVLLLAAGTLVVGALASALASPLRPAQGALLDAVGTALAACTRSGADDALRDVLLGLREATLPSAPPPVLYLLDPPRALTVDAAGYARERRVEPHPMAVGVAAREPEGVLRIEVLEALEVRRPDLRALLGALRDDGTLCCVVVARGGEAEALLTLPSGARSEALSLEEVRAVRTLASGLAGLCASRSELARRLGRERRAQLEVEPIAGALARLEHAVGVGVERDAHAAGRLARPATLAVYAAASRFAHEALARRVAAGTPVVVLAPAGVDAAPYLARAHLAGPRARGPLVIVDGALASEHDPARWCDPAISPFAIADGGTLVLLDGAALPADVQALIGQVIAHQRPPWRAPEPIDVIVALTSAWDRPSLERSLAPTLRDRLGEALDEAVTLPAIRDRAEDLRALLADRLAHEGLRLRGRPMGLDDAAFARLVDYPFDGGDAELDVLALRLATGCDGDVVRAVDVERLGLKSTGVGAQSPAPAASRPVRG